MLVPIPFWVALLAAALCLVWACVLRQEPMQPVVAAVAVVAVVAVVLTVLTVLMVPARANQ